MRRRASRLCGALVFFLCAMVPGWAQNDEVRVLKVELKCETCGPTPQYSLELHELRGNHEIDSVPLQADGAFTLRNVPYGQYQLTITDFDGNTLHQQFLTVSGNNAPVSIQLTPPKAQQPPSGPVSMAELRHPPARKALQAMQTAQKFSMAGDYEKAAGELYKAIEISPFYADAYTNLAVQHIHMGRYEEAAGELTHALEIGGPNPLTLTNLASAQYSLRRFKDAAQSGRWALRLEPDYPPWR